MNESVLLSAAKSGHLTLAAAVSPAGYSASLTSVALLHRASKLLTMFSDAGAWSMEPQSLVLIMWIEVCISRSS